MRKKSLSKRWKWLACAAAGLALLFACPLTANAADAVKYIDENGTEQTLTEYQDITQLEKPERWSSNDGPAWFVVPPGQQATIDKQVYMTGTGSADTDFNLLLCDGAALTAKEGILTSNVKSFNIYSSSLGGDMGVLTATSSTTDPAIGRGDSSNTKIDPDITINGGIIQATVDGKKIQATGSISEDQYKYPAAIGMGGNGNGGGCITINNGYVIADCSAVPYAVAIETKEYKRTVPNIEGRILIKGGQVTAEAHVDSDEKKCGVGIGRRMLRKADGTPIQLDEKPVEIELGWKDQTSDFIKATSWNGNVSLAEEEKSFVYESTPAEFADVTNLTGGKLLPTIVRTVTFKNNYVAADSKITTKTVPDGQLMEPASPEFSVGDNAYFYGWYEEDPDNPGEMTDSRLDFTQPITQDYVLMGKWGKNPYRLIFDMQGKGEASLGSFMKTGTMPETIPETTLGIENGNIILNQRTGAYTTAQWVDMAVDLDNPPTEEGYQFLGFAPMTIDNYGSYEEVSEAFAKEPTKNLSVYPHTETYYAIWAKEAANVEASATLPVCGDQVTDGKVASDPNVLIYKDDDLFTGTIVGGETYTVKAETSTWPEILTDNLTDNTTATLNGEAAAIEIKDGSHGFAAVVTSEFVPEHTWVYDNGTGNPFEWVEEDGTFHAYLNYKCSANAEHKNRLAAKIRESRDAYCGRSEVTYTARLDKEDTPDGKDYFETKTVEVEGGGHGHDWGEPEYTWSDDYSELTARIVCKNAPEDHHPTETVETTSEITKEPTYTEEGEIQYTSEAFKTQDPFTHTLLFEAQTIKVPIPVKEKMTNTLTVKGKTVKLKAKKLKKKNQNVARKKAITVSKPQGKVTYTKVKVNKKKFAKKFTINKKTGKITVKKGVKKGTYKMTVKVNAAGNTMYKPLAKTVTVKIVVK